MIDGPYNEEVCPRCMGEGRHDSLSQSIMKVQCALCGGSGHIRAKMDQFQVCNHSFPSDHVWTAWAGCPRSIVQPQKTWLDECAFQAMCGMLAKGQTNDRDPSYISKKSYQIAQAMLAEKQRIEKEETK